MKERCGPGACERRDPLLDWGPADGPAITVSVRLRQPGTTPRGFPSLGLRRFSPPPFCPSSRPVFTWGYCALPYCGSGCSSTQPLHAAGGSASRLPGWSYSTRDFLKTNEGWVSLSPVRKCDRTPCDNGKTATRLYNNDCATRSSSLTRRKLKWRSPVSSTRLYEMVSRGGGGGGEAELHKNWNQKFKE